MKNPIYKAAAAIAALALCVALFAALFVHDGKVGLPGGDGASATAASSSEGNASSAGLPAEGGESAPAESEALPPAVSAPPQAPASLAGTLWLSTDDADPTYYELAFHEDGVRFYEVSYTIDEGGDFDFIYTLTGTYTVEQNTLIFDGEITQFRDYSNAPFHDDFEFELSADSLTLISAEVGDSVYRAMEGEGSWDALEPAGEAPFLNEELLSLLNVTNGEIMALQGDASVSYIMYGGSPVADYQGQGVTFPVAFWLGEQGESMGDIWAAHSKSGEAAPGNIWPAGYTVDMIEVYGEAMGLLFPGGVPDYEAMRVRLGESSELIYTAAGMGVNYSYDFDTWSCDFMNDGLTLSCTFREENGLKMPFNVILR